MSSIKIPNNLLNMDKIILKAVEQGINDCTDDLLRVASLRSPRDEENLEKSGTSNVDVSNSKVVGQVEFSAVKIGRAHV